MKKILGMLGGLLLSVIVVAMIAPFFIPPDAFKKPIVSKLEEAFGRDIKIDGNMSMRFFPFAGASIEQVTIGGLPGEASPPLAKLQSMSVDIALLPLIHNQILIKNVTLVEPEIYLEVTRNGQKNWMLGQANSKEKSDASAASSPPSTSPARPVLFSDLKIKKGVVTYDNHQTNEHWAISDLNADASADGLTSPFHLEGSAVWNQKKIAVDLTVSALEKLLAFKPTTLKTSVKSDLLQASLDGVFENATFEGMVNVKSASLRDAMAWLSPAQKKVSALPTLAFELAAKAQVSASYANLAQMEIVLDGAKAKGDAKIAFAGLKPKLDLALVFDTLDLTPFMPAEKQASNIGFISGAWAEEGHWSSQPVDFSSLRAFEAIANITAGRLRWKTLEMGNVTLRAKVQNNQLTADIPNAELYGGRGDFFVSVNAATQNATIENRMILKSVQIGPLLKMAADSDRVSGTADINVNMAAQGDNEKEWVETLHGGGIVKLSDGAIKGLNIADMVRNVQSAFKQVDTASQKTDFAELGGTFTVEKGNISNSDMVMKAPLFRVAGKGQVNLPDYSIHYRLTPQIVDTLKGQGGKDKEGLSVPVIIEGNIDNPSYRPDMQAVVDDIVKNPEKVKETINSVKEQFKGDKKKETLKNIRGLLKGF